MPLKPQTNQLRTPPLDQPPALIDNLDDELQRFLDRLSFSSRTIWDAAGEFAANYEHTTIHPLHIAVCLLDHPAVIAVVEKAYNSRDLLRNFWELFNQAIGRISPWLSSSNPDDQLQIENETASFVLSALTNANVMASRWIGPLHLFLALFERPGGHGRFFLYHLDRAGCNILDLLTAAAELNPSIDQIDYVPELPEPLQQADTTLLEQIAPVVDSTLSFSAFRSQQELVNDLAASLRQPQTPNALLFGQPGVPVEEIGVWAAFRDGSERTVRQIDLAAFTSLAMMAPGMPQQLMQLLRNVTDTIYVLPDIQQLTATDATTIMLGLPSLFRGLFATDIPVLATTGIGNLPPLRTSGLVGQFTLHEAQPFSVDETTKYLVFKGSTASAAELDRLAQYAEEYLEEKLPGAASKVLNLARGYAMATGAVFDEAVLLALSNLTKTPLEQLQRTEREKLLTLEDRLHERVIGQHDAVVSISQAIRRARSGLADRHRPISVQLFLGPTGVGKTELAKALAAELYGSEEALLRFDMSEFSEAHTVARLVGAPPGYVGYDEGGQLTEAVRQRPHSVVLLDEIEKAHPKIFDAFLQVFDDGRLTDGQGKVTDFRNTIILMTSNLGSQHILDPELTDEQIGERVAAEVRKFFRPELLNRLSASIVFERLTSDELNEIAELQLKQLAKRLDANNIRFTWTDAVAKHLAELGYSPSLGVRPLQRAIIEHIETPLSELLMAQQDMPSSVEVVRNVGGDTPFRFNL